MINFDEPYLSPYNYSLELRNPELGNPQQVNIKTLFKQNMAGNIHSHKRTATTSRLVLTFKTLVETKKDELIIFYENTIGKEIRYTDYDVNTWRVRFVNDSLIITAIKDTCSYDAVVELLGVQT